MARKLEPDAESVRKEWIATPPDLGPSQLLIKSYQVMQRWEDNYMKSLAAVATSKGGDILEVGLGMGISAKWIQRSRRIRTHTVVECHPQVAELHAARFKGALSSGRMKIVLGFWEEAVASMPDASFDGILFDSCPLNAPVEFFHFFPFFRDAFRLLRPGGVFTYFSDEPVRISRDHSRRLKEAGFSDIRYRLCRVRPPRDCEYWKHETIVVPILHKGIDQ